MLNEFTYGNLDSNKLSVILKSSDSFIIKLTKKRAKLSLKFIELMNTLMGHSDKDYPTFYHFIILARVLFIMARMGVFHGRLFQLFIFYFNNQPDYLLENGKSKFQVIRFFKSRPYDGTATRKTEL
jgi:hypothetical protein